MKLLIAVPAYESVRVEFFRSILELEKNLRENGVWYEIKPISGTLVHIARDRLASHAIRNGFDEVLWIDSDMVFDGHIYEDLKMVNKDIVCGWFISRHYPYVSCLFSSISPVERINEVPDEAFRVKACGFGCVLTEVEVHWPTRLVGATWRVSSSVFSSSLFIFLKEMLSLSIRA